MMKKPSNTTIVANGLLWVNLPVVIIIFSSFFLLLCYAPISFNTCAIIAAAIGWIYWEVAVGRWIKWALENDVDQNRLFNLGQRSFLLWNRTKIERTAANLKNKLE